MGLQSFVFQYLVNIEPFSKDDDPDNTINALSSHLNKTQDDLHSLTHNKITDILSKLKKKKIKLHKVKQTIAEIQKIVDPYVLGETKVSP